MHKVGCGEEKKLNSNFTIAQRMSAPQKYSPSFHKTFEHLAALT